MKKIVCLITVMFVLLFVNGCYSPTKTTVDIPIDKEIVEILKRELDEARQDVRKLKAEAMQREEIILDLRTEQKRSEETIVKQEQIIQDHQVESKRQEAVIQDLHAEQKRLEEVIRNCQTEMKRQEVVIQDLRTKQKGSEEVIAKHERTIQNHQAESKQQETVVQNLRTEQKRLEGVIQNLLAELKRLEEIVEKQKQEEEQINKETKAKAEEAVQNVIEALHKIVGSSPAEWSRQRNAADKVIQNSEWTLQILKQLFPGDVEMEREMELFVKKAKEGLAAVANTEKEIVGTWQVFGPAGGGYTTKFCVKINETTGLYEMEPETEDVRYDGHTWSFSERTGQWNLEKADNNTFIGTVIGVIQRIRLVRIDP
jgi:chromosome segregation ATPase